MNVTRVSPLWHICNLSNTNTNISASTNMKQKSQNNNSYFLVKIDMGKQLVILEEEYEASTILQWGCFSFWLVPSALSHFDSTLSFRTSHWMSWEMNFQSGNPDILTECLMNMTKSSNSHKVYLQNPEIKRWSLTVVNIHCLQLQICPCWWEGVLSSVLHILQSNG